MENNIIYDESNYLFKAKTKYDENIYKKCYLNLSKSSFLTLALLTMLPILIIIYIFMTNSDKIALIIPIIFIGIIVYRLVKLLGEIKLAIKKAVLTRSEYVSEFIFYEDFFVVISTYKDETSKLVVKYTDLIVKKQDKDYFYLSFLNKFVAIEKKSCIEHQMKLKSLIAIKKDADKIKYLITIFSFLSIASIFISVIIASILSMNSPLPTFPYTMTEYLWIMFLFVPIPIVSLILGIKHNSKSTVIIAIIGVVGLVIYGSMYFINGNKVSHDYSYVQKIEEITKIDLPEGYVSIENTEEYTLAMLKVNEDESSKFLNSIKTSYIWNSNQSFIPVNALDTYSISMTTDYDYFAVYNQTTDKYNTFNGYIVYLAYDVETGIVYFIQYK